MTNQSQIKKKKQKKTSQSQNHLKSLQSVKICKREYIKLKISDS